MLLLRLASTSSMSRKRCGDSCTVRNVTQSSSKQQDEDEQDCKAIDMSTLFEQEEDTAEQDCQNVVNVSVAGHGFQVVQPPDVGVLFAHRVWSGSKLLSEYVASNAKTLVRGKRTIEFGAGTALPSLVSLAMKSGFSCITDYPDENVLQALRDTVQYNWETLGWPNGRVVVRGHEWGTSVDNLLKDNNNEMSTPPKDEEPPLYFDVAFLSECLWMHSTHAALAKSLHGVLHPRSGVAIVTYAHHIPGLEAKDDAFFDLCSKYGLSAKRVCTKQMEYMWDAEKTIDVHLVVMHRV